MPPSNSTPPPPGTTPPPPSRHTAAAPSSVNLAPRHDSPQTKMPPSNSTPPPPGTTPPPPSRHTAAAPSSVNLAPRHVSPQLHRTSTPPPTRPTPPAPSRQQDAGAVSVKNRFQWKGLGLGETDDNATSLQGIELFRTPSTLCLNDIRGESSRGKVVLEGMEEEQQDLVYMELFEMNTADIKRAESSVTKLREKLGDADAECTKLKEKLDRLVEEKGDGIQTAEEKIIRSRAEKKDAERQILKNAIYDRIRYARELDDTVDCNRSLWDKAGGTHLRASAEQRRIWQRSRSPLPGRDGGVGGRQQPTGSDDGAWTFPYRMVTSSSLHLDGSGTFRSQPINDPSPSNEGISTSPPLAVNTFTGSNTDNNTSASLTVSGDTTAMMVLSHEHGVGSSNEGTSPPLALNTFTGSNTDNNTSASLTVSEDTTAMMVLPHEHGDLGDYLGSSRRRS